MQRTVVSVTTAPAGYEGEGFPVGRAFAGVDQRALDPFIHMDQRGAAYRLEGVPPLTGSSLFGNTALLPATQNDYWASIVTTAAGAVRVWPGFIVCPECMA